MDILSLIWPFFFPILGAVFALIHIHLRHYGREKMPEIFLIWQLAAGLGLSLFYAGLGHLLMADQVAESIGWPTGSPFQREVGMWDLSLGIVGILCLRFRNEGFWTATIIGAGIFLFGAGLGHVYEMVVNGNFSPNNAGTVMYMDLLYPLFLAGLLIFYHVKKNRAA
ncbi:MAG: hypothetical protein JXQ82_10400 [Methanomicrobiaceae archaeon]|nr:hypothetical protein [Methanomicrobiaceae archaeon]